MTATDTDLTLPELRNLSRRISAGFLKVFRGSPDTAKGETLEQVIGTLARNVRIYGDFHHSLGRMDHRRSVDYDRVCRSIELHLGRLAGSKGMDPKQLWRNEFRKKTPLPDGYELVRPLAPLSGITQFHLKSNRSGAAPKVFQCYPRNLSAGKAKRRR